MVQPVDVVRDTLRQLHADSITVHQRSRKVQVCRLARFISPSCDGHAMTIES